MVRFLIICISFFLLYIGFSFLGQFDSKTVLTTDDYSLETTLFTLIAFFILTVFVVLVILKTTFLVFELPHLIRKKLYAKKAQKIASSLLFATTQILAGDKDKALQIISKIGSEIKPEHQEQFNLILAESEEDFDKKIQYFSSLITSRAYGYFAAKRLSQLFFEHKLYQQAEDYAVRVFNLNEFDCDILEILIHCYAELKYWGKFAFSVSKLARVNDIRFAKISIDISKYYFQAAKSILEQGDDAQALDYLEHSLECDPANLEALDLLVSLNVNLGRGSSNLEILRSAFVTNPSFDVAEMYIKSSNFTSLKIYESLADIVDPRNHQALFLAIAAYLGLPEKITFIREQKLLPHYSQE